MNTIFTKNIAQSAGLDDSRFKNGTRPLRVKLGMDPTAPDLHLGHAIVLKKLREFQDQGHEAILIVGSYTAQIGDPTGKNKTRPPLTSEQVNANAQTYLDQAFKILDASKTRVEFNGSWLGKMSMQDALSLMSKVSLAQILQRDDFKQRWDQQVTITMHEMMYPLLQAMDSVHLQADVELGGTDQWFNLHMGRALQEKFDQPPQAVMTVPILVGLDGEHKMSKSLNNHIPLAGDPRDSFGRFMSVSDDTMWKMLPLLDVATSQEMDLWKNECFAALRNPMHVKMDVGQRIIHWLHGEEAALDAREHFLQKHRSGDIQDLEVRTLDVTPTMLWTHALKQLGFAESASDAARKMEQGGVRLDGTKVIDRKATVPQSGKMKLEVGKRIVVMVDFQEAPGASMTLS